MSYFWRGFEKRALLWSKGKDTEKFFNLASRLASNRARNMGINIQTYKTPGLKEKLIRRMLGAKPLPPDKERAMLEEVAGVVGANTSLDKTIVVPKNMISSMSASKLAPEARPVIIHHELDEHGIADANKITGRKIFWRNEWDKTKAMGRAIKQRSFLPMVEHALTPKPITPKGYASHVSPAVLLRESNRVFHEAPEVVQQGMQSMRAMSGESADLKRLGLRYGQEFIPEGGRRWNKIVRKLEGKMPTRADEVDPFAYQKALLPENLKKHLKE
jgi:hypothetical protein